MVLGLESGLVRFFSGILVDLNTWFARLGSRFRHVQTPVYVDVSQLNELKEALGPRLLQHSLLETSI